MPDLNNNGIPDELEGGFMPGGPGGMRPPGVSSVDMDIMRNIRLKNTDSIGSRVIPRQVVPKSGESQGYQTTKKERTIGETYQMRKKEIREKHRTWPTLFVKLVAGISSIVVHPLRNSVENVKYDPKQVTNIAEKMNKYL